MITFLFSLCLKNKNEISSFQEKEMAPKQEKFERSKLEDLLKRRFFFVPSFEIYGGKLTIGLTAVLNISGDKITQNFHIFLNNVVNTMNSHLHLEDGMNF